MPATRFLQAVVLLADRWVPPGVRAEPAEGLRARLLLLYGVVTFLACPAFAFGYALDGQWAIAAAVVIAMVLGGLVPVVLVRTGSTLVTGGYATAIYAFAQLAVMVLGGGFDVGTLYWLAATTVFGSFLMGPRWGLFWLAFTAAAVAVVTSLHLVEILPQTPPPLLLDAYGVVVMGLMLYLFATVYELMKGRALRSVEAARVRAEQASHAKSRFLATMSHEIRTPLNGILGTADVLLLGELPPEERRRVELIQRSGEGLLRVVNEVLELARLDARASVVLRPGPFVPALLVEEVARLFLPAAQHKGLVLQVAATAAAARSVRADGGKLRQIATNLVANAVEYTAAGAVRLEVDVQARADAPGAGDRLRLVVEDTGIGMSAAELGRIFEPFERFAGTSARGAGLGLAISRALARELGGELTATSAPGRGSCFILEVDVEPAMGPLVGPSVGPSVGPACGASASGGSASGSAGRSPLPPGAGEPPARVLVVEDNPVNREVACMLLQSRGLVADFAAEGHAALAALASCPYDLVLMDCQMPGLDGYATTREIRRREGTGRRTPIVAMTAAALDGDRERCLAAGMDDYLTKPVTLEAIDDVIARIRSAADDACAVAISSPRRR